MLKFDAPVPLLSQVLINECRVQGDPGAAEEALERLYRLEAQGDVQGARETLKSAVEALSGGENTVLYDDAGLPSVMVRVDARRYGEPDGAASPAFTMKGRAVDAVWVSKYLNSAAGDGVTSLPLGRPLRVSTFDEAAALCRRKGAGWMPMPFAVRMAVARRCARAGVMPGGDSDNGRDWGDRAARGIAVGDGTVLAGSGPLSWSHNGRGDGLWDLCGNLNEWDAGFRLLDGEIQLMDLGDLPDRDLGPDSPCWRALDARGRLVAPGGADTLRYDVSDGGIRLTTGPVAPGIGNCAFTDIQVAPGLDVPEAALALALCPRGDEPRAQGWRWVSTRGEVLPLCGGAYRVVDHAGVFFVGATKPRGEAYPLAGVRSAWVDPGKDGT